MPMLFHLNAVWINSTTSLGKTGDGKIKEVETDIWCTFSSRHLIRSTFDSTFFIKVIIIVLNAVLELREYICIEGTNLILLIVMAPEQKRK